MVTYESSDNVAFILENYYPSDPYDKVNGKTIPFGRETEPFGCAIHHITYGPGSRAKP